MATTSKFRETHRNVRPATRRSSRTAKQVESRTKDTSNYGFLNHLFKPLFNIPAGNWRKTERELKNSLSNLCRLYGWAVPDVSNLDYPSNVSTAFSIIRTKCEKQQLNCIITKDKENITSITTVKTFDTGNTLYYIPVLPIWQLLQSSEQPILTEIWLMLFRYLYHINGVAYYRYDSYLSRVYDILKNWIEDEVDGEDDEWRKEQLETMDKLETGGDLIYTYLKLEFNAKQLHKILKQYRKSGYYEVEVDKIVKDCLLLWKDYPNRSINRSIVSGLTTNGYDEIIYLDYYLSFFWSGDDCLYDSLMELVNSELMEMNSQERPVSLQCFDIPQVREKHDHDFETRFFSLVEDMSELLNKLEETQPAAIQS